MFTTCSSPILQNNLLNTAKVLLRKSRNTSAVLNVAKKRNISSLNLDEVPNSAGYNGIHQSTEYLSTYVDLIKDLTRDSGSAILNETKQRLAKVIKHTVPCGRQFEGLGVVESYKLIELPENLTHTNIRLACILSWAAAIQCAVCMLQDDIMDNEQTRKRLPCWYLLKDVGLSAISDSWLVQAAVLEILKKHFSHHPCYIPIVKLFHFTNYKVALGQSIDMMSNVNGRPNLEIFTRERLNYLGDYKSAKFCYEFPLKLALYLAGITDPELHRRITSITFKIGFIFMAHNDMHDAFGSSEVVGRETTDIANGKCCWPSLEALQRASPSQRKVLEEHYGRPCIKSVQKIHDLYRELNILDAYLNAEKCIITEINEEIDDISDQIPKQVFYNFLTDVTLYRNGYGFKESSCQVLERYN